MAIAAAIIPAPPQSSKYFKNTITIFLSTLLGLDPDWLKRHARRDSPGCGLAGEKDPENLAEDQFFHDQRHSYRKGESRRHRHKCDYHLHMCTPVLGGVKCNRRSRAILLKGNRLCMTSPCLYRHTAGAGTQL